jgi:GSH-dependent disulfide-bond oxidoreductase
MARRSKPVAKPKSAAKPKLAARSKTTTKRRAGATSKSAAKRKPTRLAPNRAPAKTVPRPSKPIDLYYWSTPNGWKITIMLEECGLPYNVIPVNIAKGDQFKPEFLAISPNNRMPAIVDPQGPGGRPISVFESGAILQYLGTKTGKFYPADERARVEVDQWLFWQMGGLGPMAGQANHFRNYAPEPIDYAIQRYTDEVHRLYGVMNKRLADREFLAGRYSIADIACIGWTLSWKRQGQDIEEFPNLKRWQEAIQARPAAKRGLEVRVPDAQPVNMHDPTVRAVLFNQRARAG